MYQLSSAAAALPQYSAYAVAVGYVVRLVGGALVGRRAFAEFARLMQAQLDGLEVRKVIRSAAICKFP